MDMGMPALTDLPGELDMGYFRLRLTRGSVSPEEDKQKDETGLGRMPQPGLRLIYNLRAGEYRK
jgi:hypothetical protein